VGDDLLTQGGEKGSVISQGHAPVLIKTIDKEM
jgi:hypothetical protein